MSILFREHRGGLTESLATRVELESVADVAAHLRKVGGYEVDEESVTIRFYADDERISARVFIVTDCNGVLGFVDERL